MKINTKIKEKLKSLYQANSGMTLVEILIATAIIVVLMGVSMISLPRYRDGRTLEQASKDVNDTLRQAQTLALSPDTPKAEYYLWEIKTGADDDSQCANTQYVSIVADVEGATERKTCLDNRVNLQATNGNQLYFEVKTGNIYSDAALSDGASDKLTLEHDNHPGDAGLYYEINVTANTFSLGKEAMGELSEQLNVACGNEICEENKGESCGTCGDCDYTCECMTDGAQYCDVNSCPTANWYDGSCHELPREVEDTTTCGDGKKEGSEECDDGNTQSGDYCSADCKAISGQCGDGQKQSNENCDDGDNNGKYSYCDANCSVKITCGDGIVQSSNEVCDDGNTASGDSCSADCQVVTTCDNDLQYCSEVQCEQEGYYWHIDKCEVTPNCSDGTQYCKCSDGAQYCTCSDGAQYCKCTDGIQYCTTRDQCIAQKYYWHTNKCEATPNCSDGVTYCTSQSTCVAAGGWWDDTCINPPVTSMECANVGGYWYLSTCNVSSPFAKVSPINDLAFQSQLWNLYEEISEENKQKFIDMIIEADSVMGNNYLRLLTSKIEIN